jgi:hypothetical protein
MSVFPFLALGQNAGQGSDSNGGYQDDDGIVWHRLTQKPARSKAAISAID